MPLHVQTYEHLKPTLRQMSDMQRARKAILSCSLVLEDAVPDGPDKTYLLRKLREVGMWANVAITRQPDGSPRSDAPDAS